MKTKTKRVVLMEIAVVLCSVFLVATLPAIAAEQSQEMQKVSVSEVIAASEDDYTLDIYGNANEDDTIDMRDVTYTKLIIFGKKSETKLADAYYDDEVDVLDVVQIKLIILGRESELTIVDDTLSDDYPDGKPVTIKKPVNRIIPFSGVEELRTLKAKDKIVGIGDYTAVEEEFFPDISQLPTCGSGFYPDVEKILSLDPDIVISVGGEYTSWTADLEDDLKGTNVILIRLDFYQPHNMAEDIRQLGYIVDKKAEAEEFVDWHDGYMNTIYERVEGLSENEKPKIYNEASPWHTYTKHSGWTMPGGIDIAADLSEAEYVEVEPEWVVAQNPDIIFKQVWGITGYTVDDASGVEAARDEVMSRLAGVTAVTEGKVYCMDMDTTCKVYGHAYCAKCIQPELFEDLDPQAIHEECLERFQGIPYQGIWVYPPLE